MTKVSVIIAAYNEEKRISDCIESIIRQTYSNVEIVIIDDGSTDNTWKILQEYNKLFIGRIKIKHIENSGVSNARNQGIELATGDWIVFSDADDIYSDDAIERLLDVARSTKCQIVQGGLKRDNQVCNSNSIFVLPNINGIKILFNPYENYENGNANLNDHVKRSIHGPYGKIIDRNLIRANNIRFNNRLKIGEDLLFYYDCLRNTNNIAICERDVYYISNNPESVTRRYNPSLTTYSLRFMETAKDKLIKDHLWEELRDVYYFQACNHFNTAINQGILHENCENSKEVFLQYVAQPQCKELYKPMISYYWKKRRLKLFIYVLLDLRLYSVAYYLLRARRMNTLFSF